MCQVAYIDKLSFLRLQRERKARETENCPCRNYQDEISDINRVTLGAFCVVCTVVSLKNCQETFLDHQSSVNKQSSCTGRLAVEVVHSLKQLHIPQPQEVLGPILLNLFQPAFREVYELMKRDSFSRYLKSELYQQYTHRQFDHNNPSLYAFMVCHDKFGDYSFGNNCRYLCNLIYSISSQFIDLSIIHLLRAAVCCC